MAGFIVEKRLRWQEFLREREEENPIVLIVVAIKELFLLRRQLM